MTPLENKDMNCAVEVVAAKSLGVCVEGAKELTNPVLVTDVTVSS